MVVGGLNLLPVRDVEVVSLDPDNNPVPPCLADLSKFPVEFQSAAGSVNECRGQRYRAIWLMVQGKTKIVVSSSTW